MKQEDKELLLKDLCARLPYGVKIHLDEKHIDEFPYNGTYMDSCIKLGINGSSANLLNNIEKYGIKPYLRPISSMTEEEENEYYSLGILPEVIDIDYRSIDWLNAHHFDIRNLIEKGLALEAPEGMYK